MATLADRVNENIESIAALRREAEEAVGAHQRLIERAARAIGRPLTVMLLVAGAVVWIAWNARQAAPLDPPPFFWLQGTLALYAAVVATLVLASQSRQSRDAERRAQVELHVNLLAEQKVTEIIRLLEELRRDLPGVRDRVDPAANALEERVDPKQIHEALRSEKRDA